MKKSNFDDLTIADISLSEGGYNYYGLASTKPDPRFVIIRESVDETEYRYFYGNALTYTTDWTNRTGLRYGLPSSI